jgi:hypothetical protein
VLWSTKTVGSHTFCLGIKNNVGDTRRLQYLEDETHTKTDYNIVCKVWLRSRMLVWHSPTCLQHSHCSLLYAVIDSNYETHFWGVANHATAEAVSHWHLTTLVRVQFQANLCEIVVGNVALIQVFLWVIQFSPQYHSTNPPFSFTDASLTLYGKGKAIPLQALTGSKGSRRMRFPNFKTLGTWRW